MGPIRCCSSATYSWSTRLQVPLVEHEHVVEALLAEGADDPLGDGVRPRRPERRQQGVDPQRRAPAWRSRGRRPRRDPAARTVGWRPHAVASISWRQTQAAVGWAVTRTWTSSRRSWVMKNRTYSVRNVTVGTVNRSAAQIWCAWLRRNVRQVWLGGRGAGAPPVAADRPVADGDAQLAQLAADALGAPEPVLLARGGGSGRAPPAAPGAAPSAARSATTRRAASPAGASGAPSPAAPARGAGASRRTGGGPRTQNTRSRRRSRGRGRARRATASCCRRSRFSSTSAWRPRSAARSAPKRSDTQSNTAP